MTWDLPNTNVMILGAGFSAAATEGRSPLMKGFFDKLERQSHPELFDFVTEHGCNQTCSRIEDANVENVLVALDQTDNCPPSLRIRLVGESFDKKTICDQLSHYTIARFKSTNGWDTENWAVRILAEAGERTTVISMNYDVIAESILSNRDGLTHGQFPGTSCPHCKMGYMLRQACNCSAHPGFTARTVWQGALLKLHGSIAWRRCVNPACCSYQCLVADERCRPFEPRDCPNCRHLCSPAMVMPTINKNLQDTPEIDAMWQAGIAAIESAETLLIFGFSFPRSDELLVQSVRKAIKKSPRLREVAIIDLTPQTIEDNFRSCLPIGHEVNFSHYPCAKLGMPLWFDLISTRRFTVCEQ